MDSSVIVLSNVSYAIKLIKRVVALIIILAITSVIIHSKKIWLLDSYIERTLFLVIHLEHKVKLIIGAIFLY